MGSNKKWIVGIVIALALIWIVFLGGLALLQTPLQEAQKQLRAIAGGPSAEAEAEAKPQPIQLFAAEHGRDFLTYRDVENGFSIEYPVGYGAVLGPDVDVYLRFISHFPVASSEVIDIRLLDIPLSDDDYKDLADGMAEGTSLTKNVKTKINNATVYLFDYSQESEWTGEKLFYKNAVFSCRTPGGDEYTALLIAMVPALLAEDLSTMDYIIYSFKC